MVSEINVLTKFHWTMCYTIIVNCYSTSFEKMNGLSVNMQRKVIFKIKCKLPISSWPVRISILTTCVMWSHTGNFFIGARDCDV